MVARTLNELIFYEALSDWHTVGATNNKKTCSHILLLSYLYLCLDLTSQTFTSLLGQKAVFLLFTPTSVGASWDPE